MHISGEIYTVDGWSTWTHGCSQTEANAIRRAAADLAMQRTSGPVAPIEQEWTRAANSVLGVKRGYPMYGDRFVAQVTP